MEQCYGMYAAAGITFRLFSDRPVTPTTFEPKMAKFAVDTVGEEVVDVHHHFTMPERRFTTVPVYNTSPWTIYREGEGWHYVWTNKLTRTVEYYAVFTEHYHQVQIYHYNTDLWDRGNHVGLMMRTNDQVLFLPLLWQRGGFVLHSSAVVQGDRAIVLVGHSGSGKSTATNHFGKDAVVISEDRNIILPEGDNFYVYGSWIHYNNDRITNDRKRVDALYFIKKATETRLEPLKPLTALHETLSHVARGYANAEGWNATVDAVEKFIKKNLCFYLHFEKDGGIMNLLNCQN